MRKMKQYEIELLTMMRANARMSLTNLSKALRVPISTLYDRLQQQRKDVFKRITVLFNYDKLGMHARATVIIKVGKNDKVALTDELMAHSHVNSLYKINNGYDLMMDIVFPNIRELEDFMCSLKDRFTLKQTHVYYVINDLKEEDFLVGNPDPLMQTT